MGILNNLEVQLTNEHINKLVKINPIKALSELIWNSLDADATEINISFERNALEGIEHIIISDNGNGIIYNDIEQRFGMLGNSHKLKDTISPAGRKYHGKLGLGRYSGFVLGKSVEWVSLYKQNSNVYQYSITGHSSVLKVFQTSDPSIVTGKNTGVYLRITELINEKVDAISNRSNLAQELTMIFAPYLLAYSDIKMVVDGLRIDPTERIKKITEHVLLEEIAGKEIKGILKVIEWKSGNYKNMYLCKSNGIAYEEENSGIKAGVFSHTAYLQADIIDQLCDENNLDAREFSIEYTSIRESANIKLKEIYRSQLAKEATKEVKKLKEEKIYPYSGKAQNAVEEAERQVFDIFAHKINQYLPEFGKTSKGSKEFTYRLVKSALQSNPDSLKLILQEVLNLPIEQQDELASILEKTSLNSIINTTKLISDRLLFVNGLEEILYGIDFHKKLKERSQLHKILLGELWLFGEQYTYGYDDITLKNVLKKHINLLDRDEIVKEIDFKNIKTLDDIPDIGLYRQYKVGGEDCFENVIIELKRPNYTLGQDAINQVEKYAYAIEENEYFDKEKTKWKIILLGIKFDRYVAKRAAQKDRAKGLIYESENGNVEVWVKEWNQVIQEAKGKHQFLKERLELEVKDNEEGLKYLRSKYKEYLPD